MKVLFKIYRVILIILLVNITTPIFWGADRKVKLRDVKVLYFYKNRLTNSRRAYQTPQLKCKGGSAGCRFTPRSVQCKNAGWDGTAIQWECKAKLPKDVYFGFITVNCEGYDYAGDEFILQGSCGFEYTLEKTEDYFSYFLVLAALLVLLFIMSVWSSPTTCICDQQALQPIRRRWRRRLRRVGTGNRLHTGRTHYYITRRHITRRRRSHTATGFGGTTIR